MQHELINLVIICIPNLQIPEGELKPRRRQAGCVVFTIDAEIGLQISVVAWKGR